MFETLAIILIFAVVRTAYIALAEGLLTYFLWEWFGAFITDAPPSFAVSFLLMFILNIGFSIYRVARFYNMSNE